MTNRVLLHSSLALAAALALEPARAAEPACPSDRLVRLDVAAWVAEVRAARTLQALEAALARAGLRAVNADPDATLCAPDEQKLEKLHVDDFRPRLAGGGEPAHLLQVLARVCETGAEGWQVQRGLVLLPAGDGGLCRVDTPFLDNVGSPYGPELCNPTVFAFERLTAADRDALRVTETAEWCGSAGSDRGIETSVSFWEVRGAALAELLRVKTESAHYHSPTPPITSVETKLQVGKGAYPRTVQLTEVTDCQDPGDDADPEARREFKRCREKTVRRTCAYDGKAYACRAAK